MSPKPQTDQEDSGTTTTLGDLLYADRSAAAITEEDWVRLVRSVASGDQRALRALYERTHRLVFTLAMRIGRSREIAEEVTLDVFHDVWRRASAYDPKGGSVVGWIMNQARSRAIDRLRFEQRKKRTPQANGSADEAPTHAAEPVDPMEAQQSRASLEEALKSLTVEERRVIETAFFADLTYAETAVRLGQPLGTVKTRIRSALAKLRQALAGEGDGT